MVVNRSHDQAGPATLSLYFREPGATVQSDSAMPSSSTEGDAKAPPPAEGEIVVTIDMKHRRSEMILKDFLAKSGAVPVKATLQEESLIRDMQELEERGKVDRERVKKMIDHEKREKALMAQAHSEAAAIKAAL